MESYNTISYEHLRMYAYANDALISGKIRGVVVEFTGLNGCKMLDESENGKIFAQHGIAYIFPYINPWSWMNRDAVTLTDRLIELIFQHYHLSDDTPIVSMGGSMGGLCSLVYTYYAARPVRACAANCPVCDLPYHYTERPDLPRTLLSAFGSYDMPLENAIRTASPLHLADTMPKIPYYIAHCEQDKAVNKQQHSDRFVQAMRASGHDVRYIAVPERGHCSLPEDVFAEYIRFVVENCGVL